MPALRLVVQVAKTVPTGLSTPPSTPPRGAASSPGRGTPSRSPVAVALLPQLQSQLARTLHSLSLANARVLALTIRVAGLEEERAAVLHAASDEFVRGGSRVFASDALLFVWVGPGCLPVMHCSLLGWVQGVCCCCLLGWVQGVCQ